MPAPLAAALGGPLGLDPMSAGGMPMGESSPMPLAPRLTYRNQYGTNLGIDYDVNRQQVNAGGVFPLGDATRGRSLEVRGGYGPDGPSAFIGFTQRNVPQAEDLNLGQMDPEYAAYLDANPSKKAEVLRRERERVMGINRPGAPKYSIGLDVFGNAAPRFALDNPTVPAAIQEALGGEMQRGMPLRRRGEYMNTSL